jgi:hypothetical protein
MRAIVLDTHAIIWYFLKLELVERMLVYKSSTYSRQELKAMLGLTKWQKT